MRAKIIGFLLITSGSLLVIISILALVKAFGVFSSMPSSAEDIGYAFGSVLFPLLITVIGRWLFRKGLGTWRNTN